MENSVLGMCHLKRMCDNYAVISYSIYNIEQVLCTVKAPNIAHLSLLTSVGYNKKQNCKRMHSQIK